MSETDVDIDIPRDPATGQFTADNAERFGLAGVEDDNNFVPLTAPSETDEIEGDPESVRAAFDDFVERGGDVGEPDYEPTPIFWQKTDGSGEPIAPKVTTTLEQAGTALSAYEHNVGSYVEGAVLDHFVAEVDQARAELLKSDPGAANELGLDPAEVAKNAQKDEPAAEKSPGEINEAARQYVAQQPVDGLDPKIAEAMAHPQVRQAIEQELGKASAAQQAADVQRNTAYLVNQQAILTIAPELEGLEPHQWPDAIKVLAQIDPARAEKVINLAQRGATIEMQMLQEARQREAVQDQQFQTFKIQEEAKFNEAVGALSQSDYDAVRSYATGVLGLTPQDVSALQNNPVAVDHRFQRALLDASRFHAMNNASKAMPTRTLPPVTRPGPSSPRPTAKQGNLAALERAFAAAPEGSDRQIRIASEIVELRRASR